MKDGSGDQPVTAGGAHEGCGGAPAPKVASSGTHELVVSRDLVEADMTICTASCGVRKVLLAVDVLRTLATPDDVVGPLHIFGVVLDICRLTPSNLIRLRREMNCLAPVEAALC